MAITHTIETRNTFCASLLSQLDESAKPGVIELQTVEDKVVAVLEFSKPSFGPPENGMAIANRIFPDTNAKGGTVVKARFKNGDRQEKFSCSVTAIDGGGDIELSTVKIPRGFEVIIPSLIYTAPL